MTDLIRGEHLIKICGITTQSDARAVVTLGASAVGLILSESRRRVTVETAGDIVREVRRDVACVAVVRNESDAYILDCVDTTDVDAVQVHGTLSEELRRGLRERGVALIKALGTDSDELVAFDDELVDAVLVDGPTPGSGAAHPWSQLTSRVFHVPLIAAGGLTPDNVADVIAQVKPWGVDVATGVETSPGVKDLNRVKDFIRAASLAFEAGE